MIEPDAPATASAVRPVFSIWAWLALTPYLVTAFGGADLATSGRELGLSLLSAAVVQIVLLGVFMLIGALEQRVGTRPWLRWTVVGIAIVGIAVARPALLTALQRLLGIDLVVTPEPLRFLMNVTFIAIAILLLYAVVETIGRAREAEHRLEIVREALATEGTQIVRTRLAVLAAFQGELARDVLDALGGLLHRGLPPDSLAKELRWIARSVVQRAAAQARSADLRGALDGAGDLPIVTADAAGASRAPRLPALQPGPGWAVTLAALLLFLPPAINAYGSLLGLLELVVASVVSQVLAMVIRRTPMPPGRHAATALLATLYLLVGGIYAWILLQPLELELRAVLYFVYGTIGYALVGTTISLIDSSLRRLREHQQHIAAAIAESEHHRFEAQRALVADAALAGRLLDTDVQGDILATSYLLEAGTAPPDALAELVDRVEGVLRGRPIEPLDYLPLLREGLGATLHAWSLVLTIDALVEDDALDWLAHHPGSSGVIHDALTEGLTNAIRYGRGRQVEARLQLVGDDVELIMRNPGRLGPRDTGGVGLRDLETRAQAVELRQDEECVELRVVLATSSPR